MAQNTTIPVRAKQPYRFDPIDIDQVRLLAAMPPSQRLRVMLEARDLAVGLIRGRLRKRYPELSEQALNLKLIEEINRAQRPIPRF